ncbi:hypothetical protein MASR1M12_31400 [Erysipelotrichia bacterium]
MSVSLLMIPVALALRAIMGKDNFESWVDSLQVRIPTSFKDKAELIATVKKAGFDAENWGGSIKTHFNKDGAFFFWEFRNGSWEAVFAKADFQIAVTPFLAAVESQAGRVIFLRNEKTQKVALVCQKTYPTNFREPSVLKQVLTNLGSKPHDLEDGCIKCSFGQTRLVFQPVPGSSFAVQVENFPEKETYASLALMDEEYRRCIQTATYERLLERIEDKNLVVESEEVMEDNSVVITLLINE